MLVRQTRCIYNTWQWISVIPASYVNPFLPPLCCPTADRSYFLLFNIDHADNMFYMFSIRNIYVLGDVKYLCILEEVVTQHIHFTELRNLYYDAPKCLVWWHNLLWHLILCIVHNVHIMIYLYSVYNIM